MNQPNYTFIVNNAHYIVKKLKTHKQYIVAKELNLTPQQLSILTPLLKAIVNASTN